MRTYASLGGGIFGGPMSDIFGFDDLSQAADPLSEANLVDVEAATRRVAQFNQLFPLIQSISDSSVKQGAMDIVNKQWYKVGTLSFIGLGGKYNLQQLAQIVSDYAALPNQQFVYFNPDFTVNRTRENRLNAFVEGMRELQRYMGRFIILPVETQVNERDTSAEGLLRLAQGKAQAAKLSGNPQDASVAYAIAESAVNAGQAQGNQTVVYAAQQIMADMRKIMGGKAGTTAPTATHPDALTSYLLIGGGAALLIGLVWWATNKK